MWRATAPWGRTPSTSSHPAQRPRPTRHVTGAPVTTCEKLHRHLRQCRAFLTAEPVPRLEATLLSGTIIRGTLKTPNSQLVTPISIKLQRPDGHD
jgi:hypothetical protein